jgi:two-component system, OmpR family, sensor histidine kinase TctE
MKYSFELCEELVTALMLHMVEFLQMKLERISLAKRLVIFLSIPLTLLIICSVAYDYKLASETINLAYDAPLVDVVTDLESLIRFSRNNENSVSLSPEIENLIASASPDSIYFSIRDKNAKLIAGNQELPWFDSPGKDVKFKNAVWNDKNFRVATHCTSIDKVEFHVTVMETTLRRTSALQNFLTTTLGPNLIFTVLALLCVWYTVRIGLAPLKSLEQQLSQKNQNDLSLLLIDGYPPEIKPILSKLNELLAHLDKSHTNQRRFLADAAHQLRTPLTCLQTNMEIFIAQQSENFSSTRLQNAFASIERMSHLVSKLLAFARAEDVFQKAEKHSLDLSTVVEEVSSELFDFALEKSIEISFELSHVFVTGIEWMLQEVVVNLIDNAIRYTPAQGQIHINCDQQNGVVFLEVRDSGPGIKESYRELVLERFFRIPGTQSEGCGLGLSVVNQICKQHDAQLTFEHNIPSGLIARIEFPSITPEAIKC